LNCAVKALNKEGQPWEVTVEGYSIVARYRWKDATFIGVGARKVRSDYTFIVTLDDKGVWTENDEVEDSTLGAGPSDGGLGIGGSYNISKGKHVIKTWELGLGRDVDILSD